MLALRRLAGAAVAVTLVLLGVNGEPRSTAATPAGGNAPSGVAMPVGDLPADSQGPNGWHQVFADDFTMPGKANANGKLPGGRWRGYRAGTRTTDSSNGVYDSARTVSVSDGQLVFTLHSESGTGYAAVETPALTAGQVYGRYDVRYRYEPGSNIAGFKSVWMLWPDDDHWGEGEIDFNEYDNAAHRTRVYANLHRACADDVRGCAVDQGRYALEPTQWHTATAIWSPGTVTAYVDGHLVATSTTQAPSTPLHLLLQTEASSYGPQAAPGAVMKIDVDWVVVYTRG
jgi:beta-glucanase (GH16 family)